MNCDEFIDFIQTVTGAGHNDHVAIARGSAATRTLYRVQNLKPEFTAGWLDDNLYFGSAVFDGQGQKDANTVKTAAILIDLDCGTVGHKKASPFATVEESCSHLSSLPV